MGLGVAALALASAAGAEGPVTVKVAEFSTEFSATVRVDEPTQWGSPGVVTVRDRKSGKAVLEVDTSGLPGMVDAEASANLVERPYGEQSVLIHDDFDFDGRKDFAIQDGNNSCYGGPSFQIFLRRGKGFKKSEAFTRLAQEYCGMFGVDAKQKQLSTFWKSGCCQHGFETWGVVGGVPVERNDTTEDYLVNPGYLTTTTSSPGSVPYVTYTLPSGDEWDAKPLFSFLLRGKRVRRVDVFVVNGHLDYALSGDGGNVELSYGVHVLRTREPAKVPFGWNSGRAELSFKNGEYRYVIHDSKDRLGVSVQRGGHETFLPAKPDSRAGTLAQLVLSELDNVRAVGTNEQ